MMIYAATEIRQRTANFCDPTSSQHRNSRGGEGGVMLKKILLASITATCFSNPQTNLGAHRSKSLGVRSATN